MLPSDVIGRLRVVAPTVGLLVALIVFGLGWLGALWLPLDVLAHFRMHALGFAIVCALAVFVGRCWLPVVAIGAVLVMAAIGAWGMLSEQFTPAAQARLQGERTVKLLSLNSWLRNDDWEQVERMLRREDADIVTLLEFGPEKAPMLADIEDLYPYQASCLDLANCHVALLSKEPIVDWKVASRWAGPPLIQARFGKVYDNLTVIGAHILRPPHIYAQKRQLEALATLVQNTPDPLAVMGDFNATQWSSVLRSFEATSGLRRLTGLPSWPVWTAGLPQLPIDHIFISQGLRVQRPARLGPATGSDHLPVTVTIILDRG